MTATQPTRTWTLNSRRGPVEVVSTLSDIEVDAILRTLPPTKWDGSESFAASLSKTFQTKPWSESQRGWAHKLANDASAPPAPKPTVSLDRIFEMLRTAGESLRFPSVLVWTDNGRGFRLSIAGSRAKFPGSITITSAERTDGQREWYGRVLTDGEVTISRNAPADLLENLEAFAADPEGVAAKSADIAGACSFCNRELTDARSTGHGYGPVCAKRYGLAW